MIRLDSKNISPSALSRLAQLHHKVIGLITHSDKTTKVAQLWKAKTNSVIGKKTFGEIREKLVLMCLPVEVCNYCEQNEANDIEHIYPKSFFPEQAFVWENYLLACKQCNTAYKLDLFAVLDDNDDIITLIRGNSPPYQKGAFINPRAENPSLYFMINLSSFEFDLLPDLNKTDTNKAQKTLEVLQLNQRQVLLEARLAAAKYFYQRMKMLSDIVDAETNEEIANLLTPYDNYLDENLTAAENKATITSGFKRDIQTHQHPSVWHAIKIVKSKTDQKWISIFSNIPESLTW